MRTIRRLGALCLVTAVVLVAGACAPPPTSGVLSGFTQACTPIDSPWANVDITFVSVPVGSTFSATRLRWVPTDPTDTYVDESYFVAEPGHSNTVVAGQTVSVTAAQPGRCVRLDPTGGLTFRYTPTLTIAPNPYQQGWLKI